MAKKPDAARGKTTRKGRVKKMFERLKQTAKGKKTLGMSPGAMGGRSAPKRGLRPVPTSRTTPRRGIADLMKKTALKGAGASGAAMAGQAMKLAKKLKPTGRVNVDDLKRAKQMIMKRKDK